jgi:hypothetical protein
MWVVDGCQQADMSLFISIPLCLSIVSEKEMSCIVIDQMHPNSGTREKLCGDFKDPLPNRQGWLMLPGM